ncbi:choline BCCT transporter BetT [Marinobacter daepoensis]|uniref:Choline BCCT transporter BetT n=1 Tax=Marinobacter daepoensis TaxID=262077 RepID=A0ABS3BFX7_9GAMM|nr:choline BCCT transporter BetT [Marinobacter daepoensis]MBN7769145.1 choline BCCT transporter BetT [Marinobacter daepoensis]MBY6077835.1 choline BCCT transporter BetT [Marinobacter daepoensis]
MARHGHRPVSGINAPVFYPSAALILLFVLFTIAAPDTAGRLFGSAQSWIIDTFGWFYLLSMGIYLALALVLALSRYGQVKLGPDHSEPDFSYLSWFAMLFSAGMGIGLVFYGVAEPVFHFAGPPVGEAGTPEAAREAMKTTFFHWGIHAWGVYAIVALALAYFSFRHNLPLRISSALYPLIGKRIHGPIGNAVDVFAVFGTMFGIATSLGLGVMQINAGLNYLFDIPSSTAIQLLLIAVVTGIATLSVAMGLDGGIRRVSEWNIRLAVILLAFVIITGPTLFIFQTLAQNIGTYLSSAVEMTFNTYAYAGNENTQSFMGSWTLFYWAWFIAWSPFVGMFVARVSRGRTIREFVLGVIFVPVGVTCVWLTVFGDTALHGILTGTMPDLVDQVFADSSTSLFHFLDALPWASVTSVLATLLVITFFVTSSDSGSLVIDTLTSKDNGEAPVWQRIFWAVIQGLVAGALILAGGSNALSALQAASLASALPFAPILILVGFGLFRSLRIEACKRDSLQHATNTPGNVSRIGSGSNYRWQQRLKVLVSSPRRQQVLDYLDETVQPAMQEVALEFEKQGLDVRITREEDRCYLRVSHGDEADFIYGVRARAYAMPSFTIGAVPQDAESDRNAHYRAEVFLREGGQQYSIVGYLKGQVIGDILDQYEKHLHFLHLVR